MGQHLDPADLPLINSRLTLPCDEVLVLDDIPIEAIDSMWTPVFSLAAIVLVLWKTIRFTSLGPFSNVIPKSS
jgi:hypothetical protein